MKKPCPFLARTHTHTRFHCYKRPDSNTKMPLWLLLSTRLSSDYSSLLALQLCAPKQWKRWLAALSTAGPDELQVAHQSPRLSHLARLRWGELRKQLGSLQTCSALLSLPLPSTFGNTAFLASTLARRLCADCWPRITSSPNKVFISRGIF